MESGSSRFNGLGWLIAPLLLAIYVLSFQGTFQSDDEHIFAARAQSLALHHDLEAPQVFGNSRVRQQALWGDQATEVEPALSIIGAGFYWLALKLGLGGAQMMFVVNLYVTAFTSLLIYHTCRLLDIKDQYALLTALGFGLCTYSMPYAFTFYRDPLAMLMAAASFFGLAAILTSDTNMEKVGFMTVAGGILLGTLSKNVSLALIPSIGLGYFIFFRISERRKSSPQLLKFLLVAFVVMGVSSMLPPTGILARFSGSYYLGLISHFAQSINVNTLLGTLGPWVSPAKSIFLFAPMALLAIIPSRLPKRLVFQVAAFTFAFLIGLAQSLFYGTNWYGGYGWGLRFMLPALPGIAVSAGFAIEKLMAAGGLRKMLAAGLFGWGLIMQQSASWRPWRWAYDRMIEGSINPLSSQSVWNPATFAPFWQVTGLFSAAPFESSWLRLFYLGHPQALLVPIAAGLLGVALLLVHLLQRWSALGSGQSWFKGSLVLVGLCLPIFSVSMLQGDPALADDESHFQAGINLLDDSLTDRDSVVIDAYGTSLWYFMINRWDSTAIWYSLPYEIPSFEDANNPDGLPAASSSELLGLLLEQNEVLYYLSTPEAPDFSLEREKNWLDNNATLIEVVQIQGDPDMYIYAYRAR